ncbi:MAG TPA: serine hydrolase [Paracoccaceae bacterium]|nr:serine hydrolase [Paracoccaceae bacterium]
MKIRFWLGFILAAVVWTFAGIAQAAPYAAFVMDARTGEVVHSRNADTRLHPASLTKMMTLYLVFNAIENGDLDLDERVTISRNASLEPPSKLGLRAGQKIAIRHLIRAAAIKSANDAATALGEAVSGSETAFAKYMTMAARAMGMNNTTFKNANGLTANGHYSTAHDMATLGRRLFYDFPEYYHLFSRVTADAAGRTIYNTNRKFLGAYRGADGIKTGYTAAAGFNLVGSAERGGKRVIAAMFGGTSVAQRNAQMAKLLDLGFDRVPGRVAVVRPKPINLSPANVVVAATRENGQVTKAEMPVLRASGQPAVLISRNVDELVLAALENSPATKVAANTPDAPTLRPQGFRAPVQVASIQPLPNVLPTIPRQTVHEPGNYAVELGNYRNRGNAERLLLQAALMDLEALEGAVRRIEVTQVQGITMYQAQFVGLSKDAAENACARMLTRDDHCQVIAPGLSG